MRLSNITLALLLAISAGCHSSSDAPQTIRYGTLPPGQADGNLRVARQHFERGIKLYEQGKLDAASAAYKDALTADVTFGPAHNSLGSVYFDQKQYYLAAWEFQYAAKLMPRSPEPKNNLGLVFETVGDLEQATDHYAQAHSIAPDDAQILGNFLRSKMRAGDRDSETKQLLREFLLKETRPDWVAWANRTLAETKWE